MNAEESFDEDVSRLFTKGFLVCEKNRCKLSCKTGCRRHIYFYKVVTWGGVLQASVMTWGGVAKPPVMPRGVGVAPHPWNCLRGTLRYLNKVSI